VQGQPLGRAWTDAGQPLELVDQPGQGSGETAQGCAASRWNLGKQAPGQNGTALITGPWLHPPPVPSR
jgi:hypothetical protein